MSAVDFVVRQLEQTIECLRPIVAREAAMRAAAEDLVLGRVTDLSALTRALYAPIPTVAPICDDPVPEDFGVPPMYAKHAQCYAEWYALTKERK